MSRLAFLAALFGILVACEDNEHPFGDAWDIQCTALGAPAMIAVFREPRQLDDSGRRRAYIGHVEVPGLAPFPDVWIWQLEVNDRDGSATTVSFDHVLLPEAYEAESYGFLDLDLEVATYEENEETTGAAMTGTCEWGGTSGALQMFQGDDCDTCFTCDTPRAPGLASTGALALLIALRRRREPPRAPSDGLKRSESAPCG